MTPRLRTSMDGEIELTSEQTMMLCTGAAEQREDHLSVSEVHVVGWWIMPGVVGEW